MIFDRTQNDVDTAIRIRREKVQTFQELTESEITTLEKGTITYNTLNRIESKQAQLQEVLKQLGYLVDIEAKHWTESDIFDEAEFDRILRNLDELTALIAMLSTTPPIPEMQYHFQNINDIEKILFDLDFLLGNAEKNINFAWAIGIADTGLNFTS